MVENTKVRAAAYLRVSTLLGQDPENQRVPIEQHARERGWQITEVYLDEGISGTRERRPALDRLIADAARGKFEIVIVAAIDRIGRNTRHMLNLVNTMGELKVAFVSIREGLDFSTPMGKLMLTLASALAELEVSIVRDRIRTALATKRLMAERTGSGWRCGRPRTSPEIEAHVRELRARGLSVRAISRELGGRVGASTVSNLLRTPPTQAP